LQQLGLLQRVATERDGRESAIEPSAAGIALREQLDAASGEVSRRLKKELGQSHFDETVTNVKKVRSVIT